MRCLSQIAWCLCFVFTFLFNAVMAHTQGAVLLISRPNRIICFDSRFSIHLPHRSDKAQYKPCSHLLNAPAFVKHELITLRQGRCIATDAVQRGDWKELLAGLIVVDGRLLLHLYQQE